MDAIRAEHLTKTFGDLRAVDDLSLSIREGEIFGLVGPDGAGKTTTMRLLTSIMEPSSGEAWVGGHHVVRQAEQIKEQIGYMSQRFGLYPDLTVLENIHFYADVYDVPRRGRREKIERLLAFSNLAPFRRRLAGNLSGGMKQKLGLACALVHTPRILFLDEPTNGVDPVSRRDFWRILYQLLRQQVTIFVSTAYLDEAERANRLALISGGRLLACGTPDELKKLMRGTILEIQSPQPREAAARLRARMEAESGTVRSMVGLFGDRVHLVTLRPDEAARQAGAILAEASLPVTAIRAIEPSLEDVFVSVLGAQARSKMAAWKGRLVLITLRVMTDCLTLRVMTDCLTLRVMTDCLTLRVMTDCLMLRVRSTGRPWWSRTSKSGSAASWPWTASASRSAKGRSSASSGPTARENRPRSACSAASSRPPRAPARSPASTSAPSPKKSRNTSAT